MLEYKANRAFRKCLHVMLTAFLCLVALLLLGWACLLKDPHLLPLRPIETPLILLLCLVLAILARGLRHARLRVCLPVLLLLVVAFTLYQEADFQHVRATVLTTPTSLHMQINGRMIVGFTDFDEAAQLAENGVAGLFLSARNVQGRSFDELKNWIEQLQRVRLQNGLPPLHIASDQEGGVVSRLSPLLPRQPPLSHLLGLHNSKQAAFRYGLEKGRKMAELGVDVNFSPVVDLKPDGPSSPLDFHTRISTRAISSAPAQVIELASAYVDGLRQGGVTATLKHFPGLARVSEDTHHFAARLRTPVKELLKSDWLPFLQLGRDGLTWVMLSHVILQDVDPDRPVSTSRKVVDELLRNDLGFEGRLVTDDMTMGATYYRGFCLSIIEAYETSIDYILISYDPDKYFDAVACLSIYMQKQRSIR